MSILSDVQITTRCLQPETAMIAPFHAESIKHVNGHRVPSFGVSSYGYDATLADEIDLFTDINGGIVDARKIDEKCYVRLDVRTDEDGLKYVIMPPNSFVLGRTREYFRIPRDLMVMCVGKSTFARAGLNVTVTPLEPEWHGHVVIEVANMTNLPNKLYLGVGICQFMFFKADSTCEVSYADRGGKYQGQTGLTHAKV